MLMLIMSMMLQMKDWISQSYRKIQCSIVTMSRQTATQGDPNECSPLIVALAKLLKRSKCTFSGFNIFPICSHFLFCGTSAPLQFSLLAGLHWNSWAPSGRNMERQYFITELVQKAQWIGFTWYIRLLQLIGKTCTGFQSLMIDIDWTSFSEQSCQNSFTQSPPYIWLSHKVICKTDRLSALSVLSVLSV